MALKKGVSFPIVNDQSPVKNECFSADSLTTNIDLSEDPYDINDNLSFSVIHNHGNISISYDADTFWNFRAVNIRNIIYVSFVVRNTNSHALITINDSSDQVVIEIYAYKNVDGVFLSTTSITDCIQKSYLYQLNTGQITQIQYDRLVQNLEVEMTSESSYNPQPFNDGTISPIYRTKLSGDIFYKTDEGITYPIKDTFVQLCSSNINDEIEVVDVTHSNDLGHYSFTFENRTYQNDSSIVSLFVRIHARTSHSVVRRSYNIGTLNGSYNFIFDSEQFLTSSLVNDSLEYNKRITFEMADSIGQPSYIGRAFQISQALYYGEKYVYEMSGIHPVFLSCIYPNRDENYCFYNSNQIKLVDGAYNYWDVILHEYGHHIQHMFDIIDSPGGTHHMTDNCILTQGGDKEKGIKIAWGESWNTVYAELMQRYYYDDVGAIRWNADSRYTSYNGVDSSIEESYSQRIGEGCELNIIQVLFDMFDEYTSLEPFDRVALGHQGLWNVLMNSSAVTFSEFVSYCYAQLNINTSDFGALLENSGMAVTGIHFETSGINKILRWQEQNYTQSRINDEVNDHLFRSNIFVINFYNLNGIRINSQDIVLSNQSQYTIDSNLLNLLNLEVSHGCYVQIEAYQDYGNIVTGPYLSSRRSLVECNW